MSKAWCVFAGFLVGVLVGLGLMYVCAADQIRASAMHEAMMERQMDYLSEQLAIEQAR